MPLKTLLLIDDDEVDRLTVARTLEDRALDVRIDSSDLGLKGIEMAKAFPYDCILVDYHLPDISGLELLQELRRQVTPLPALIMLTGEGNELVAVEAMKRGANDYLPKGKLLPGALIRALSTAVEKTSLQRQLAENQRKMEQLALFDPLTTLGNRNLFHLELDRALAIARRKRHALTLILLDLDRFKEVNDTYGHEAGDAVLAEAGRRLASQRDADAYFRLGGDEFVGILHPDSDGDVATQRLRERLTGTVVYEGQPLPLRASIGWSSYPADGETPEELIRVADEQMYEDKKRQIGD